MKYYDNFELAQIRGEEEFHLEEEEAYEAVIKSHKEDKVFLNEMARKTAKKQVEESLSARKGKIPSLLEMLELEDDEEDDEIPF